MDEATGEAEGSGLRVAFDRRLKLEFHGATVTYDAGLLAFRELDDARPDGAGSRGARRSPHCYHPLLVFNQDGDLERCALRPGNVHSAHGWHDVLDRSPPPRIRSHDARNRLPTEADPDYK